LSKQRYVDTKFWDDNYIVERDPIEKLLYLYILTNTLTNILGIYEISLRRIAFDTGIDKDMVIKILERFEKDNKIKYSNGFIVIKNFVKHQADNPKINKGIELLLKETPVELIEWIYIDFDRLGITKDSLYIGLNKTSKDSNYSNTNTNNNINTNLNSNNIYSIWNNQKIIVHESIKPFLSAIKIALDKYAEKDIITAIKNYGFIVNSSDYYYDHKYPINKFLTITAKTNHIEEFKNLEIAKNNYKKGGKNNGTGKGYNNRYNKGPEKEGIDKYKHLEEIIQN